MITVSANSWGVGLRPPYKVRAHIFMMTTPKTLRSQSPISNLSSCASIGQPAKHDSPLSLPHDLESQRLSPTPFPSVVERNAGYSRSQCGPHPTRPSLRHSAMTSTRDRDFYTRQRFPPPAKTYPPDQVFHTRQRLPCSATSSTLGNDFHT